MWHVQVRNSLIEAQIPPTNVFLYSTFVWCSAPFNATMITVDDWDKRSQFQCTRETDCIVDLCWLFVNFKATVADFKSSVADFKSSVADFKSTVADFKSSVADFKSAIAHLGSCWCTTIQPQ
jgi:hypothetical protein